MLLFNCIKYIFMKSYSAVSPKKFKKYTNVSIVYGHFYEYFKSLPDDVKESNVLKNTEVKKMVKNFQKLELNNTWIEGESSYKRMFSEIKGKIIGMCEGKSMFNKNDKIMDVFNLYFEGEGEEVFIVELSKSNFGIVSILNTLCAITDFDNVRFWAYKFLKEDGKYRTGINIKEGLTMEKVSWKYSIEELPPLDVFTKPDGTEEKFSTSRIQFLWGKLCEKHPAIFSNEERVIECGNAPIATITKESAEKNASVFEKPVTVVREKINLDDDDLPF